MLYILYESAHVANTRSCNFGFEVRLTKTAVLIESDLEMKEAMACNKCNEIIIYGPNSAYFKALFNYPN